jgi:aminoglycoside phosphotransferase (APT) family kinase protein
LIGGNHGLTIPQITVTVNTVTVNDDLNDRLLTVLRNATGAPGLEYDRRPEPMSGGFWAELFSLSLANPPDEWPAELVARLMPDPDTARKETIVQSAVAAAGFPTPLVRASGGPDCGLGRAFMVMDRAAGGPALSGLDGGLTPAGVLRLLRRVPGLLAGSMARLHALDPDLVRGELERVPGVMVSVTDLLTTLARFAAEFGRPDLIGAARWLTEHPPAPAPDVICHGDLHPFNLLADGDRVTLLDWSTALLAPRAYDVAFTSLLLSEPPLRVPRWQRPLVRAAGRELARRFVRGYQRQTATTIGSGELRWYQAVVCLRALVEVASWVHQGVADTRVGHPWLMSEPAFAGRVATLTGVRIQEAQGDPGRRAPVRPVTPLSVRKN